MKKIVTLSIVCLVSGHLFAQNSDAKSAVAPTKAQVEAQKQKETSSLSLKQAIDQKIVPATQATTVAPIVATALTTDAVTAVAVTPESDAAKTVTPVEVKPVPKTEVKAKETAKPAKKG